MTIQRQYSLPNCKLILEGLTSDNPVDGGSARPLLSMLTRVECRLSGAEKPLVGGRDFLEHLATAVSEYAQSYLSGISQRDRRDRAQTVQIHRVERNLHRLSIQPQALDGTQAVSFPPSMSVDLNTVQLFDLVEAIDQFHADAQTLPELALRLAPLPKRAVAPKEPAAQRLLPAALGMSGLAVAAAALFFLPVPEVRRTQSTSETTSETTSEATPESTASPSPDAAASRNTDAASPSPEATASPSPVDGSPSEPSDERTDDASQPANESSGDSTATAPPGDLDALTQTATNIADPAELDRLTAELQGQLYSAWAEKPEPTFTQPLEYQVGVDETGQVVGYKYANDPALTYINEIPLSDIQFAAPTASASGQPSLAQFLVVFRPEGVLEISPWYGIPPAPTTEASPEP
jgi:cytoskeletal protein RodZ